MTLKQSGEPGNEMRSKRRRADGFATIEEAIDVFRAGQMVIVVDDEDREN